MNKICYLHLGFHKTASSSFQVTCNKNRELLRSFNINYPIFINSKNKGPIYNHSIPIRSLYSGYSGKDNLKNRWNLGDQVEEFNNSNLQQLEGFLEGSSNLILSGEGISTLDTNSLKKLVDKIKSYDFKIHIFALIRRPYSFYCSWIQEFIKGGKYSKLISLDDALPKRFNNTNCLRSKTVEKLKSTFKENIQFYNFENACKHNYGPVGFLIDKQLQLEPYLFKYFKDNESIFNLSVRLQNEQNKFNPAMINGEKNPNYVSLRHLNKSFSSSGKFLLTENEYNFIKDSLEIENKKYLDLLGEDFVDKSIKFSKPILHFRKQEEKITKLTYRGSIYQKSDF